jgi:hypothetical protein
MHAELVNHVLGHWADRRSSRFYRHCRNGNSDRMDLIRRFLGAISRESHHGPGQSRIMKLQLFLSRDSSLTPRDFGKKRREVTSKRR